MRKQNKQLKQYPCQECKKTLISYGTLCKACFFKKYPHVQPIEQFIRENKGE